MDKIRVAEVITRMDWGGSPDIYRILAANLDPAIYDVTLIIGHTAHPTRKTEEFLSKFAGRVIFVPSMKREIDPLMDLAALAHLTAIFASGRFDVVHTHTAKAGALGRMAAKLCGVHAIVHTPHGHNFYGYFDKKTTDRIIKIETFLTRCTDRIIALTALEKADMVKFKVAAENKIDVIYQGLELDKYVCDWKETCDAKKIFGISPGDNVVGMVGRLERVKGADFFVEAAAGIIKKFPDTKFIIAGEGALRKGLEEKASKLGLGSRMIFAGWRDDVPAILSMLDIMVLPSLNEAVGMALIEAQAEGIPVVATDVGGISEVVRDKVTGILVGPGDSDAIAGAVTGLLSDKSKLKEMGSSGKIWVRDKFNSKDMLKRTSDLYMEILHEKKYFV